MGLVLMFDLFLITLFQYATLNESPRDKVCSMKKTSAFVRRGVVQFADAKTPQNETIDIIHFSHTVYLTLEFFHHLIL